MATFMKERLSQSNIECTNNGPLAGLSVSLAFVSGSTGSLRNIMGLPQAFVWDATFLVMSLSLNF